MNRELQHLGILLGAIIAWFMALEHARHMGLRGIVLIGIFGWATCSLVLLYQRASEADGLKQALDAQRDRFSTLLRQRGIDPTGMS